MFYFREINTEDGINFDSFIEELRLVSMTNNEHFRDAFCDPSRSNNANTFHDEGKEEFSVSNSKQLFFSKIILFTEITKTLSLYPWYHGNIRRSDSANLVLHKHVRHILAESGTTETRNPISSNTSGVFLVRLSGTRYKIQYTYFQNVLTEGYTLHQKNHGLFQYHNFFSDMENMY